MKKYKKIFTKSWCIAIICVALVSVVISTSVAIYTNQGYKKGVAITAENIAMFSSSLLEQISETKVTKESNFAMKDKDVSVAQDDTTVSFSFQIFNYAPNTPTRVNPNDISYTLKVTIQGLSDGADTSGYRVESSDNTTTTFTNMDCTITGQNLAHGDAADNTYTIYMPKSAVSDGNIVFSIIAQPTAATLNVVNHTYLAANVIPLISGGGSDTESVWSGHWVESKTEGLKPSDCAAFNYEITGSGSGKVKLTWPDALSIDKYFNPAGAVTSTDTSTGTSSIEFPADSSKQSVYIIRFYRTGSVLSGSYSESDFSGWPQIITYIPDSIDTETP